jgi:subtilisin family serine protease
MRHTPLAVLVIAGSVLGGCRQTVAPKAAGADTARAPGAVPSADTEGMPSLDALQREAAAIAQMAGQPAAAAAEKADPAGAVEVVPAIDRRAPANASPHAKVREATMTLVSAPATRFRRDTPKAAVEGGRPVAPPRPWRGLGFAGGSYEPQKGVDAALLTPADRAKGRGYTYAFLVLNEQLSEPLEKELQRLGVQLLGPHGGAQKARVPVDPERLRAVAAVAGVESLAYARADQKIDRAARDAATRYARELPGLPVIVSAFDAAALEELRAWLTSAKATTGRVDAQLLSVSAVVSPGRLDELAGLDTVLYVELSRPTTGGHDFSMAVMGADYIRPGGFGTRFSGTPVILGILDTGFMVGGAAATTHQDLNKFGCGRNFSSDAAGVWNDQNGHGTHVLATIGGTGTAQARFRGVATGIGGSGTTRIRAGKIWNSSNTGTNAAMLNGQDYMDDGDDCGSGRPQLVSISGGAQGANQTGTDSLSRSLDQRVWDARQTWVVCGGNTGPGGGTIWSPGVAKNAITVGNVLDNGDGTIGDAAGNSSLGPTGDGRMKPTLVATGNSIRSARAGTTNDYTDMSGCSMATPHVSGIAATVMEHYPEFRTLPHLMRAHLLATALLHDNGVAPVNNTPAPDTTRNTFGLGRVSPYTAHWAHLNPNGWSTHWAWRTITRNQWGFRDIEVPRGARRLVVAMTWDEPAASAGASAAVDHDLDLWIDRAPFCTPDPKGQCGEFASQSWIDNVEYQIIENPPPGTYRLKIVNWDAPSSGLPAALAATIVMGSTTPNFTVTGMPSPAGAVPPAQRITVTTTVSNPSWILSGVHLRVAAMPTGVTLEQVETTREDNVAMAFPNVQAISLGSIVQGDSRQAAWRFRIDTPGAKTIRFTARSENGGVRDLSVTINAGT